MHSDHGFAACFGRRSPLRLGQGNGEIVVRIFDMYILIWNSILLIGLSGENRSDTVGLKRCSLSQLNPADNPTFCFSRYWVRTRHRIFFWSLFYIDHFRSQYFAHASLGFNTNPSLLPESSTVQVEVVDTSLRITNRCVTRRYEGRKQCTQL